MRNISALFFALVFAGCINTFGASVTCEVKSNDISEIKSITWDKKTKKATITVRISVRETARYSALVEMDPEKFEKLAAGLEAHRGRALAVAEEIAEFCEKNYGVKFDMLEKVVVKGPDKAPLYKYLTSKETDPKFGGEIKWNFTKFLISRDGAIVARFEPGVKPESEKVTTAIEAELIKK